MSKYSELADRLDAAREPVHAVVAWEAGSALRELEARVAELEAERDRLRALCNWAAGRLLDAGDVQGHEKVLATLAGREE